MTFVDTGTESTAVDDRLTAASTREPKDDAAEAEAARSQAAIRLSRGVKGKTPEALAPRPQSPEEYADILPGMQWVDPEGAYRTKPYEPKSPDEYRKVPEGADWVDPDGQVHTKPVYEDISFTSQTLYNMATNDKERRKALEYSYPGKVKTESGTNDVYVEDEGKMLKPRGFTKAPLPSLLAGAAPTVGAIAGEVGGTFVAPGPGSVAGAVAGATAGQAVNDLWLKGLGITDRTAEELGGLAISGVTAGGGSFLGRIFGLGALGAAKTAAKVGQQSPVETSRQFFQTMLEVRPEEALRAASMAEKGLTSQPISPWAPGAPHLINIVEVYDRAFHGNVLEEAAATYYDQQGKQVLAKQASESGSKVAPNLEGSLAKPTAAVSTRPLGEKLMEKARERVVAANDRLKSFYEQTVPPAEAKVAQAKGQQAGLVADLEGKVAGAKAQVAAKAERETALKAAEKEARDAATNFMNAVFQDIQKDIEQAVKVSGAGRNSGELWGKVAEKFRAARQAFGADAAEKYGQWATQYGSTKPGTLGLAREAEQFITGVDEEFKSKYPDLIVKMAQLAGVTNAKGEVVKAPVDLTMAELHELRTMLRHKVKWEDLRSDWLNGAVKKFAQRVDETMRQVPSKAETARPTGKLELKPVSNSAPNDLAGLPPEEAERTKLVRDIVAKTMRSEFKTVGDNRTAMKELDKIDGWYRENGAIYDDQRVNAVIRGLKGGEPADPKILYDTVIKEGRSDLNKRIEQIVGPNIWRGIQAADADALMQATKTAVPGEVDGQAFVREVIKRYRDGTLESIHGKETAAKWLEQVRALQSLDGKMGVKVQPGDKIADVMNRIQATKVALDAEAKTDPLKLLKEQMTALKAAKKGTPEVNAAQQELGAAKKGFETEAKNVQATREKGPLGFLFDESYGAGRAANEILAREDLIIASEQMFGRDSPEFQMLQQTWAKKVLSGTIDPGERLAKVSEEIQRMIFPGVSYADMQTLAKEMDQLVGARGMADQAKSMAAQAKVENPQSLFKNLPASVRTLANLPLVGVVPRAIYGAYFASIRKLMSKPEVIRWLAKGLENKDPEAIKAARVILRGEIRKATQYGGAGGAGLAEGNYQMGTDHSEIQGEPVAQ